MNSLNSVIIEGNVKEMEVRDTDLIFKIESTRIYKDLSGERKQEIIINNILVSGNLKETCKKHLTIGREIRAVGRISKDNDVFVIFAEHIEFKNRR